MKLIGEYISPAYPDKLANRIIKQIVQFVLRNAGDAICNLKCSIFKEEVLISGFIIHNSDKDFFNYWEIETFIIKMTYNEYGYWYDMPSDLPIDENNPRAIFNLRPKVKNIKITFNVNITKDREKLDKYKKYVMDQTSITGYAVNCEETNYVPVAQYLASKIGKGYDYYVKYNSHSYKCYCDGTYVNGISNSFKILVCLNYDGEEYTYDQIIVNLETNGKTRYEQNQKGYDIKKAFKKYVYDDLVSFKSQELKLLNKVSDDDVTYNLIKEGYSNIGGPYIVPGISGKKLYDNGPEVPVANRSFVGKDYYSIDYCGLIKADEVATNLVKEYGYHSVIVNVKYLANTIEPYFLEAYAISKTGERTKIDDDKLPHKSSFSKKAIFNDIDIKKAFNKSHY